MRTFEFDAAGFKNVLDVYGAFDEILTALQSSCGGNNVNALIDAMVYGGIDYRKPYVVRFLNVGLASEIVNAEIALVVESLREAIAYKLAQYGKAPEIIFEIKQ